MWVPAEEAGEDLDIEIIVPPECGDVPQDNDSNPDHPSYSHYGKSNQKEFHFPPEKEHTLSPHAYGHPLHRRQQHHKRQKHGTISIDDPEDQGFVDIYDSDRDESILILEPTDSARSNQSQAYERHSELHRTSNHSSLVKGCARSPSLISLDSEFSDQGSQRHQPQRIFHRPSAFVPARYAAKFHNNAKWSTKSKKAQNAALKLPPSFSIKTRYGKEAQLISGKTKRSALKQWPTPPIYPPKPKMKDSAVDCQILRMVETIDIGTQNVPIMKTKQSQFGNPKKDSFTQYPRVRRKDVALDPKELKTRSQGIQNVATTKNAMVETTVSVMYHPNIVVREDVGVQATATYSKEYGWSNIATDGSSDANYDREKDMKSDFGDHGTGPSAEAGRNLLDVPRTDEGLPNESRVKWNDIQTEKAYETDDYESASEYSNGKSTSRTLDFDLSPKSHTFRLDPELQTARELVGLPDSCSEDDDVDEEGNGDVAEEEETLGSGSLRKTTEADRHLPPLSVCGRSSSMSSVQVPVEQD